MAAEHYRLHVRSVKISGGPGEKILGEVELGLHCDRFLLPVCFGNRWRGTPAYDRWLQRAWVSCLFAGYISQKRFEAGRRFDFDRLMVPLLDPKSDFFRQGKGSDAAHLVELREGLADDEYCELVNAGWIKAGRLLKRKWGKVRKVAEALIQRRELNRLEFLRLIT